MPRPRNIERTEQLCVWLPESLLGRLTLHLWSDAEQRVPHGAFQRFITQLLTDYFKRIDSDV